MNIFSSLTNRIFLASAVLTVVAIAVAVYRVNVAVTAQSENELRRGIDEAGTLLEEYRTRMFEHFAREGRLVADLSNMKAAMTTDSANRRTDRGPLPGTDWMRSARWSPTRQAWFSRVKRPVEDRRSRGSLA